MFDQQYALAAHQLSVTPAQRLKSSKTLEG